MQAHKHNGGNGVWTFLWKIPNPHIANDWIVYWDAMSTCVREFSIEQIEQWAPFECEWV